ncbi:MAG: helix-hairpin-helix domain-containing protein [Sedimentisphaerales bacterium]|nr:helix-hairpin-helix domain-containing protein [Sedimentisphaerales bacterium]
MGPGYSRELTDENRRRIQSTGFVISVCVCVVLSGIFVVNIVGDAGICGIDLDSRINPNNAPIASLVRLPGVGLSRASAIVAYREACMAGNDRARAFEDCNDLQKVKGIGPKTAEGLADMVTFE